MLRIQLTLLCASAALAYAWMLGDVGKRGERAPVLRDAGEPTRAIAPAGVVRADGEMAASTELVPTPRQAQETTGVDPAARGALLHALLTQPDEESPERDPDEVEPQASEAREPPPEPARLQARWAAETPDETWNRNVRRALEAVLDAAQVPPALIGAIDCRTTLCRAELDASDLTLLVRLSEQTRGQAYPVTMVQEQGAVVLYLPRDPPM